MVRCHRAVAAAITIAFAPQLLAQEAAKPVFENGEAQEVEAFKNPREWIVDELWVEASFDSDGDGKPDRLHVEVTRQQQTDTEGLKVPVVYETSPYYAGVGGTDPNHFWNPHQELGAAPPKREPMPPIRFREKRRVIDQNPSLQRTWVPRGFAVVKSESPGTGLSQGCPSCGGDNEALAPKAVIDWLNGRAKGFTSIDGDERVEASWCTGKVGMTGTSYNGTLPVAAATTGVDGLEAIIPIAPNTSYYHYYRSNGLVRHPGGYMGEDIDVLYDFINSGRPERREYCNQKMRDELFAKNQDRRTGDYNDFWAGRDYANKLDNVHAAMLMAHGFNDWNVMPEHTVRIYEAIKRKGLPCMAYFHQGGHGGPPPLAMQNRWFTRFLYGVDNGVERDPKAWIVREDGSAREPQPYPDYPNPQARAVKLHLRAGGAEHGGLVLGAGEAGVVEKLVDDVGKTGESLAKAEKSENRLLYCSPELTQPLHISGTPRLTIRLAASKPAANLSVWLVALPWEPSRRITDNIITRGWADPQNRGSLRESSPLEPGKSVEFAFDLEPDDQVIPAGQSIALMIFSSDRDFTLWPEPGTELAVELGATELELPIVGGEASWSAATAK